MSCSPSDHEFFTLAEVQEFLCENCGALLPSASLFAKRKIRYKIWHQEVPEPEEIVHIVFEKYWTGSRKMRKAIIPRTQVFLAIASVLSNLATHSENKRMTSLFASRAANRTVELEDHHARAPDGDLSSREECARLLDLLNGNELDHRVLQFILGRPETTSREFMHAVRPRVIASELRVTRHEIYRSLERMRKVFESLQPSSTSCNRDFRKRRHSRRITRNDDPESVTDDRSRIPSRPKFMSRSSNGQCARDETGETASSYS